MHPIAQLKAEKGITFTGVVAMTPGRVIGKDGGMPWHLPEDLKTFKRLTMGHPILMGRKTYDSIGKPLPGRRNIVLTRHASWHTEGVETITEIENLSLLQIENKEICIIGGAEIFTLFLPWLDTLWVSKIKQEYEGDTFFPEYEDQFSSARIEEEFEGFNLWKYSK